MKLLHPALFARVTVAAAWVAHAAPRSVEEVFGAAANLRVVANAKRD